MRSPKPKSTNFINYVPLVNNFVTDATGYTAAGVAFTDGRHVIAGYQPHKKGPGISGIGGGREPCDVSYMATALRETVEELFEPQAIPKTLLSKLATIAPQKVLQTGSYINVIYTFDDLHAMLKIMKRGGLVSPLYTAFPKTLTELVMTRTPTDTCEISHLSLLPVITGLAIDPYFIADMPAFS
jgi:hypothetical protein